jgi:single-stranded-DNA-specific exonuclease
MNNVVTPMSVAFYIVPMMNAMIRVGTMEEKQRLFRALIDGHEKIPCNKRGAKGTLEEAAVESLRECTNARSR